MDDLKNLKEIRDIAWTRIKGTGDYKLATHLDVMIPSLEKALNGKEPHDARSVDRES